MRILLIGEASFVHSTLRKGLRELGHDVTLASAGNIWNCPRDIDLKRDMRYGKLSGLKVIWKILRNIRKFVGNDIVQMNDFHTIPLKLKWNKLFFLFLKLTNKKIVRGCWGDDMIVFQGQAAGLLKYSDTHIGTKSINVQDNKDRVGEQNRKDFISCCKYVNEKADALVACLYEYYVYYNKPEFKKKLYYKPLPIEFSKEDKINLKGQQWPIKVLVGVQKKRDYIKGASIIAKFLEKLASEYPDKIEVKLVYDVPYDEYCKLLNEADVLVDQFYSYTPSMNSLAAMARGTVVIGGGEEDFYNFIGEKELRPIINVSPELSDDENTNIIRNALLTEGNITKLSEESFLFVKKYHNYLDVAKEYENLYKKISLLH